MNYVVLVLLVIVKWATIQGNTGIEALTFSIFILLGCIALLSLFGELLGKIVGLFASLTIILVVVFVPITGWVTIGFLELLNLGFEYQEGVWYQDLLAYTMLGMSYNSVTTIKATITNE